MIVSDTRTTFFIKHIDTCAPMAIMCSFLFLILLSRVERLSGTPQIIDTIGRVVMSLMAAYVLIISMGLTFDLHSRFPRPNYELKMVDVKALHTLGKNLYNTAQQNSILLSMAARSKIAIDDNTQIDPHPTAKLL